MQDKLYDVRYDTGDKVIQCGRHNDIFKLWLQWQAKVRNEISIEIGFPTRAAVNFIAVICAGNRRLRKPYGLFDGSQPVHGKKD